MPLKQRKKAVRSKPAARARRSVRRQKPTPLSREFRVGAAALGILGFLVIVMMVAARPQGRSAEDTLSSARSENAASQALIAEATAPRAAESDADADDRTPKDVGTVTAPVTITGCLERSNEKFRLRDTEGEEAPRARSWRSGFLKKGPAPVQVVDAANRLKLTDHVGERVSVTGTLIDREMRIRSLHRVASSCTRPKTEV